MDLKSQFDYIVAARNSQTEALSSSLSANVRAATGTVADINKISEGYEGGFRKSDASFLLDVVHGSVDNFPQCEVFCCNTIKIGIVITNLLFLFFGISNYFITTTYQKRHRTYNRLCGFSICSARRQFRFFSAAPWTKSCLPRRADPFRLRSFVLLECQ